ncbi:MAG: hypothetical protein AB7I13_11245, partial [Vicinamibacterales bacterium]
NGSLFVGAQYSSSPTTITFNDRITAVNEVIRRYLSNGMEVTTSSPAFTNQVRVPTSSSTTRTLAYSPNEGSVTGMPGSAVNTNWVTLSKDTYKNYIRTGVTGAKRLDLPLVSQGAMPVDLIRRPDVNSDEDTVNPVVYVQRYFAQASVRILLSDRVDDIMNLPTVSAGAPVLLNGPDGPGGNWTVAPPAGYGPVDATHPPIARSMGPASTVATGGSYSNPFTQIYVADNATAIPNVYKLPTLTVTPSAGAPQNVVCRGKTGPTAVAGFAANSFFGCNVGTAVAAGATVSATIDGRVISRNVVGTIASGTNSTITVGSNDTAAFSPNIIWVNNPNATVSGIAVPVTCEGYTDVPVSGSRRFLNCRGLTAAPNNNTPINSSALQNQDTGTIGGYIKVEKQDADGNWTDVTMEILNLGIGAPNSGGTICADPTPDAVIRIQRLRDNAGGTCTYAASQNSWDWWPNALYDAREGSFRDSASVVGMTTQPMRMAGVMHYIALDVGNLKKWLAGTTGTTGDEAWNNNGYIVYFSDRRSNHDAANGDVETGEFGFEDHVNSTTADGLPDGVLQNGEDVNVGDPRWAAGTQQLYGAIPWNNAVNIPTGATAPYDTTGRPQTQIPNGNSTAPAPGAGAARVNKQIMFRRALKIVNGCIGTATASAICTAANGVNNLPDSGLTIVAENPVYVHGNYNAHEGAPDATWSNQEPNRPAAIIGDAITLLSRNWSDARSFELPNYMSTRDASTTSYRFAALAGKGLSFTYCGSACGNPGHLFGTDGGAGNFLRILEDWGATGSAPNGIRYRGSIVSLHINRQAIGTYRFASSNNHIYNAGPRNFSFDIDFLTPSLLPPGTPMFRDVNTLQFRQILRPNQ